MVEGSGEPVEGDKARILPFLGSRRRVDLGPRASQLGLDLSEPSVLSSHELHLFVVPQSLPGAEGERAQAEAAEEERSKSSGHGSR